MSHDAHTTPGIILHDGCPQCEERIARGVDALNYLDDANAIRAWELMLAEKWSGGHGADQPVSNLDLRLASIVYAIAVFLERNAGINPHETLEQMRSRHAERTRRARDIPGLENLPDA